MFREAIAGLLVVAGCGGVPVRDRVPPVPPPTGAVTDIEGNVYPTIVIGGQEWMVENLKTATYNDGTPIPNVTDADTWANRTSHAYAWYDNDIANKDLYGALYNWYTTQKGILCPLGWRMPSTDNWDALAGSLGGTSVAGGRLKESGTDHWDAPNAGATNESGFTALPAGRRELTGTFFYRGQNAMWWCSDEPLISLPPTAYFREVSSDFKTFGGADAGWPFGLSVRCFRQAN
jgi:uncharacterized protein (TIGR02145 family)